MDLTGKKFAGFVSKLRNNARGIDIEDGCVPSSTYWLVDEDNEVVGRVNIRHELTPKLERFGGHIGYAIAPSQRRKGYGTMILKLALVKAKELCLKRILITCDIDNIASRKIIENNGGVFQDELIVEGRDKLSRRYWIEL